MIERVLKIHRDVLHRAANGSECLFSKNCEGKGVGGLASHTFADLVPLRVIAECHFPGVSAGYLTLLASWPMNIQWYSAKTPRTCWDLWCTEV